jgi:phosphopantetheine--protein transferase-like protein
MTKVLHKNELEQIKTLSLKSQVSFLASRWAAKEALVKAANDLELVYPLIEVGKDNGRPQLVFHGENLTRLHHVT